MTRRIRAVAITAAAGALLSSGVVAASAQVADPSLTTSSVAAGSPAAPAADSPDATAGEDLTELMRLSDEAGALGEEIHLARAELTAARDERDRRERGAGVAAGRAAIAHSDASRDQTLVDHLATRRYRVRRGVCFPHRRSEISPGAQPADRLRRRRS